MFLSQNLYEFANKRNYKESVRKKVFSAPNIEPLMNPPPHKNRYMHLITNHGGSQMQFLNTDLVFLVCSWYYQTIPEITVKEYSISTMLMHVHEKY